MASNKPSGRIAWFRRGGSRRSPRSKLDISAERERTYGDARRRVEKRKWPWKKQGGWLGCGEGTQDWAGVSGRVWMEVSGRWSTMAETLRRGRRDKRAREKEWESAGSAWIKRKVCGGRDVSAAEAACLPRPLLALRLALREPARASPEQRVKDRDIASLCARTPFPSFIYLCLTAAGKRSPLSRLFSPAVPLFLCRTVYVSARDGPALWGRGFCLVIVAVREGTRATSYLGDISHTYARRALLNSHVQTTVGHIKFLRIAAERGRFERAPNITTLMKRDGGFCGLFTEACPTREERSLALSLYSHFDCLRKSLRRISHARATIIS